MDENKPLRELRSGRVIGTIWENTSARGSFLSTTLSKLYLDNETGWKKSNRYSKSELKDAANVIQDVLDYIELHEVQSRSDGKP